MWYEVSGRPEGNRTKRIYHLNNKEYLFVR
jgi:hypothetical protein